MKQLNQTRSFLAAAALAAVVLFMAGGCQQLNPPKNQDAAEDFLSPDEPSELDRINELQVARGNAADATLRAYHFHRGALNSLGRQKLDQMMAAEESDAADAGGDDGGEMVVYLDVAGTQGKAETEAAKRLAEARQDAVTDYLLSRGLTEDSFRLEMGSNPDDSFLATSALGSAGSTATSAATTPGGTAPGAPAAPPAGGSTSGYGGATNK